MVWCLRGIGCAQKGYHKKERGENCSYLPIMTKSEIDRPTFPGIKYIPIYIYSGHVFTPPPLVDVTTLPSPGDVCIPYPLCVPCPCAWRANFTHTFFILSASPSAVRFSVGLSACMSVYLPVCLSLPLCFSVSLSLSVLVCLSVNLPFVLRQLPEKRRLYGASRTSCAARTRRRQWKPSPGLRYYS